MSVWDPAPSGRSTTADLYLLDGTLCPAAAVSGGGAAGPEAGEGVSPKGCQVEAADPTGSQDAPCRGEVSASAAPVGVEDAVSVVDAAAVPDGPEAEPEVRVGRQVGARCCLQRGRG